MFLIEIIGGTQCDKELRAIIVFSCICHCNQTTVSKSKLKITFQNIENKYFDMNIWSKMGKTYPRMKFIFEWFSIDTFATHSSSSWISSLYNKTRNKSVKYCCVVIIFHAQLNEIPSRQWCFFWLKIDITTNCCRCSNLPKVLCLYHPPTS